MSAAERIALLLEQDLARHEGNVVLAIGDLIRDGVIVVPRVRRGRHELPTPETIARDIRDIDGIIGGLAAMYGAAYRELEPGGLGEGGGTQVWDSNPTEREAMDARQAERRTQLRELADLIKNARDSLWTARNSKHGLAAILEPNLSQQVSRAGKVKTTINDAELRESLEARARRRGWHG